MDIDSSLVSLLCYLFSFIFVFVFLSYVFYRNNNRLPQYREWWWVLVVASLVGAPVCGLLVVYFMLL